MNDIRDDVRDGFREIFGADPAGVWSAPGRIDLPGLAIPVSLRAVAAVGLRDDRMLRLASITHDELVEIPLSLLAQELDGWPIAPALALASLGADLAAVPGLDVLVDSVVPSGVGLSSRSAVAAAVGLAASELWRVAAPARERSDTLEGVEVLVVELGGGEADVDLAIETARTAGAEGAHASAGGTSVFVIVAEGEISRLQVALDGAFAEHGLGQPVTYAVTIGDEPKRED